MSLGVLERREFDNLTCFVDACRSWMLKYCVSCPESFCQTDRVNEALPELGELIGEWVGYPEYNEETGEYEYE